MNLELHHKGHSNHFDIIKEKFKTNIQAIKNSEFLTPKNKKVRIKVLKRSFLKEKKASDYSNF